MKRSMRLSGRYPYRCHRLHDAAHEWCRNHTSYSTAIAENGGLPFHKQDGRHLDVSVKTLETHRGAAMRKAGFLQRPIWSVTSCAITWCSPEVRTDR
jgi:hypothetical protein